MTKKSVKLKISGYNWTIRYGNPGKTNGITDDGSCDYSKREIIINKNSQSSLLNVLTHEIIHARLPDFNEEAVEEIGCLIDEAYTAIQSIS